MNITQVGSPNFSNGRQGKGKLGFIIHWIVGNLASADATFQNRSRNTSAHFGIEDNEVHQYVSVENTAYHAGNWNVNLTTVGIEHSAQPGRDASDATYETSAQLIAKVIRENSVGNNLRKHSAIVATACPGTVDLNRIANRVNEILGGAPVITPAPTPPTPPSVSGTATVTVDALNVRAQPTSASPIAGTGLLRRGDQFNYSGIVQGENVRGVSTWIRSTKGNYVWAGGTNYATTPAIQSAPPQGGIATVLRTCNVRTAPRTNAPLGGSKQLVPGDTFKYSAKVYGDYVGKNNVWYHSLKGNYVWSGNVKG